MGFTAEVTDYDVLDADKYLATCAAVTPGAEDGPYGPYLDWDFDVVDPATGKTVPVSGRSGTTLGPSTKAREWAEALLGRPLEKGSNFDFDTLAGRPCQLVLEVVEKEKGTFNKIARILPAPRRAATAAAPAAAAGVDPEYLAWKAAQVAPPPKAAAAAFDPDDVIVDF